MAQTAPVSGASKGVVKELCERRRSRGVSLAQSAEFSRADKSCQSDEIVEELLHRKNLLCRPDVLPDHEARLFVPDPFAQEFHSNRARCSVASERRAHK